MGAWGEPIQTNQNPGSPQGGRHHLSVSNSVTPVTTTLGIAGVALYVLVGFLYLSSGLVVPMPWLPLLWIFWAAGWYLIVRMWQSHRTWVPMVAVGAGLVWWAYLTIGESLFGWTA